MSNYDEKFDVERDEAGRFVKRTLDPEIASEMARRRWEREREDNAAELLRDAGYDPPSDAPAYLRMLAEKAATNASTSVTALRAFVSEALRGRTGRAGVDQVDHRTEAGICPLCGAGKVGELRLTPELAEAFLQLLDRRQAKKRLQVDTARE